MSMTDAEKELACAALLSNPVRLLFDNWAYTPCPPPTRLSQAILTRSFRFAGSVSAGYSAPTVWFRVCLGLLDVRGQQGNSEEERDESWGM